MDTNSFRTYAGLTVRTIKETDEETGKIAEEYVEAVIAKKEGTKTHEEVVSILNMFPNTGEVSNGVSSLIASLFFLVLAYEAQ